jgi:serine/threonine protein kinase
MTPVVITLTDFGLARREPCRPKRMDTFCGTIDFLAPEMIKMNDKTVYNQGYGKEIDIWAIGIIAFVVMSGKFPFKDDTEIEIMNRIVRDGIFFDRVWAEQSEFGMFLCEETNGSQVLCEKIIGQGCLSETECN